MNSTPANRWFRRALKTPLAVLVLLGPSPVRAQDKQSFDTKVRPLLVAHCASCHAATAKTPKGTWRLDKLTPDFAEAAGREHWQAVLKRIKSGEMPPKPEPRLAQKDLLTLTDWIAAGLKTAPAAKTAEGRVALRRLNRIEYENTVRDLLGVELDLREMLPPDSSGSGFDNNAEALHTSSFLMDRYLEAADAALGVAIANLPQPPLFKKRLYLKDERAVKVSTESVFLQREDDLVMYSSSGWNAITVGQFYPQDRGKYRIRISAFGHQSADKPVTFRVDAGPMLMGTKNHLVGYFDAPAGKPRVIEFVDHFESRNHIRISPHGLANAQTVVKLGAEKYDGAGLAVQWVDVEGPLHDTWPPESHRRIFGEMAQAPAPVYNFSKRVEVVSKDPAADVGRIMRDFTRRAFRRTVTEDEVRPYITLVNKKLAEKHSFEQAVRVGLKAVMVSPDFLFLREKPGRLNDFALASRLSYFLWSTMPDEELLALAGQQKLCQPDVLRQQAERLLKHPKAASFTENFVGQWLGLRDIDSTAPDFRLYPEFDEMLKTSMIGETHSFFNELLHQDLSLANFVSSDFTFLNERLAKHYGIPGVEGPHLRKVTLPAGSHRGGVLTMGSVLKVTANGTSTSPVVRGAWVLDRILGTPPYPPPPGIPGVEPDIRGATTIREQLAKHRQIATCANCHTQIDPPGFALENFDVIGGWRDSYRSVGRGKPVTIAGKRMPYSEGPKIDPADELPDGRKFRDIDEFKQLLLRDKDLLARSMAVQLLTYATGAPPGESDKADIDAIIKKAGEKNHGVRSLVHEIVQSKVFQTK